MISIEQTVNEWAAPFEAKIQERQKEELLLYYQQFLQNPIASQIKKLLEKHENNIVDFIATRATSSEVTDQQLRYYAIQLAETRKITKTIYDPETFLSKSTKH